MPTYDYRCLTCDKNMDVFHQMSDTAAVNCPDCGKPMEKQIGAGSGFMIKGGTPAIHWREKRLRTKMNEEAGERMKKRYPEGSKAVPNIAGVHQESWSDCQKLAKESGMNHESYQPLVDKEKSKKIKVVRP